MNGETARERNMDKVTNEYIEALYLIRMYSSDACVKGNPRDVKQLPKKLNSKTARYRALNTNINIQVKGFGWDWCQHAWTKNGSVFTVVELTNHLEWIVREEKTRKPVPPSKPNPNVPQ